MFEVKYDENTVVSFKDDILKQCRDTYEKNCTDELALCEKRNKTDNPSLKQQLENEDKEIQKRCIKNCQFMTGLFKLNVLENEEMCYYINTLAIAPKSTLAECLCRVSQSLGIISGKILNLKQMFKLLKLLIMNKNPKFRFELSFYFEERSMMHFCCSPT